MDNSVEIKNLSKSYKGFALKNIDMIIPKGTIMGFVGENGAGKSTTIKLILDLIKRDSGKILVFGKDNIQNQSQWKEDVGVVLDECFFSETLNAKNINLIMKNMYKNWDEKQYFDYLKKFDIDLKKKIKEYSRGMKMKISIAAALSHKAKLLILDEATSGLDPMVRDEILDMLLEFIENEENSVLISSHIISDLEKISDYITIINKGEILLSQEKDLLLEEYGVLKCSKEEFADLDKSIIKGYRENKFGVEALVLKKQIKGDYFVDKAGIEDIMLYLIKGGKKHESVTD